MTGLYIMFAVLFVGLFALEIRRKWHWREYTDRDTTPKFVSWYRAPLSDRIEYLAFMPPYDEGQFSAPEGEWFYTFVLANAFRFDTFEQAKAKTPSYDGSHGIEGRSGVYTVRG